MEPCLGVINLYGVSSSLMSCLVWVCVGSGVSGCSGISCSGSSSLCSVVVISLPPASSIFFCAFWE